MKIFEKWICKQGNIYLQRLVPDENAPNYILRLCLRIMLKMDIICKVHEKWLLY